MNDSVSHPTRLSRQLAGLARWSLRLGGAVVLMLVLAWAVLHAWIVPRIGDYRHLLQQQASQALGSPVQIGVLAAYSRGWLLPSIEVRDVQVLDAQQRPALHLPRILLTLSPRSVWRLGLEQLYIERPALQIRRATDGSWWVAGLPLPASPGTDHAVADWFFSQPEVVIQGGNIHWLDEQRGTPPLALEDITLLLRNGTWRHQWRIDATPPPEWGQRFTLLGRFREPLLSTHSGRWQQWSGQFFAYFSQVDIAQLRHHANLVGVRLTQGQGALRTWLDIERGQVVGGVADVALTAVHMTTAADLSPLILPSLQGRLGGRRLPSGFELHTQNLQFVTDAGIQWPGGNVRLRYQDAEGKNRLAEGELQADQLDLAALTRIAARLPLPAAVHQALQRYTPEGLVEVLQARWQGSPEALQNYQVRTRVRDLALAGTPPEAGRPLPADAPLGLRRATVDAELSQAGGKANLLIQNGALMLPGVFEDPWLPLQQLSTSVRWQLTGERIAVQLDKTEFANADAQGTLRAHWHSSDPRTSSSGTRFPGVLDLSGHLSRADGTRVHRYLPLDIPAEARHYVRDAVRAGAASSVDFRVKGDLHHMPFTDPRQGEFRIAARVHGVHYAYVPPHLQSAGELPWPALTGLAGELVFEGASMRVRGVTGSFAGLRQTRVAQVQAHIPDLENAVVAVAAQAKGPLPELLGFLRESPVQAMLGNALAQATGSGNAELQLQLQLPISMLEHSKVQGKVLLAGNDIRITPDSPQLSRARGTVEFTDNSLSLRGVQAKALGGDVRLEGGLPPPPPGQAVDASALQLRAQGTVSAQGLQQAPELGLLSQLAHHASGTAPYSFSLGLRRGVPQLQIDSNLQGLTLNLPPPLGKTSETAVPLHLESHLLAAALAPDAPLHEQLSLQWGTLGQVQYVRDLSGPQPKVLRGRIAVGLSSDETIPLPEQGVAANVQLAQLDTDAWQTVWDSLAGASATSGNATPSTELDYLPQSLALRVGALTVQGRTLHQVVAAAVQQANHWQVNMDARQLGGYAEYHPPGSRQGGSDGRLFARLARLQLPQSSATSVEETLLDVQPGHLPALDIVVEDFELRQRDLGQLQVQASNRTNPNGQNEWRLHQLALQMPEARFSASGNWAALGSIDDKSSPPARRTALNFTLDIRDAGQLLTRFGMADVVRRGQGQLTGQVAWRGAPSLPDYPSMTGKIHLDIETGQFLKADPGLAKLLSVLSLQSLPRRFTLDFRDVFSEGFAFDFVRGDVQIEQGVASSNNLQMKGVNAAVLMEGQADIQHETQELHVVVVPEINAMTASLVATAINPVVGLGSFLAQMFLRGPLMAAATQEFRINGSWTEPQVTRLGRESKESKP